MAGWACRVRVLGGLGFVCRVKWVGCAVVGRVGLVGLVKMG